MNYALAREIYGGKCWAIQAVAIDPMLSSLSETQFDPKMRRNSVTIAKLSGEMIADSGNSSSSKEQIISVTKIDGVVTKSGGQSSRGMKELSADLLSADADPNLMGHLFIFDTPGGSLSGMKCMKGTMAALTKPIVGLVEQSGMAASAGYALLSQCDFAMCEDNESEVGCIGIINGTVGHANGTVDGDNAKHFIVFSDGSEDKNAASRAAIENDDTSLMLAEANEEKDKFHAMVKAKMPNILASQLKGAMYPAKEVVGTMIHAIGNKMQAIQKIAELAATKKVFNKNQNKVAMTAAELLAQHPTVHAEILAAGVSAEKDRVDTWMVYHDIDPEAVAKGIESGKAVSGKEQATFLVKAAQGNTLNAIKRDSAGNIITAEAVTEFEVPKTAKQLSDEKEFATAFPKLVAKGITLEKFNAQKINAN